MADEHLAAIVETSAAAEAIAALEETGQHDDTRRIEQLDDDRLAIPVTGRGDLDCVTRYASGVATTRRLRTLEDHLLARGWDPDALADAPASYARIGTIVAVDGVPPHRPRSVAKALLDLHGDASTVLAIEAIEGDRRRPQVVHLAGERTTHTVHREHGIEYALDLEEIMFSPGNQRERVRMGEIVDPGEHVVDLCAGIGYFALPMAAAGASVTAIERTPSTFRWLSRNVTRNGLDSAVTPVCGDCRRCVVDADRAVIGHLPVHDCRDDPTDHGGGYLDAAVESVETGWLHVHGIAWADAHDAAAKALRGRLEGRGVAVTALDGRSVKGMAPRTEHVVIDARIEPA